LFERLSVFVGGWSLEAAQEICAGDGIASDQVIDLLAGLVEKSLVSAEEEYGNGKGIDCSRHCGSLRSNTVAPGARRSR